MRAVLCLWVAIVPLHAAFAAPVVPRPCDVKRLGLEVTAPADAVAAGKAARLAVTLRFEVPTAAVRVSVVPGDALYVRPEGFIAEGPWWRGDEYRFEVEVTAMGAGAGEAELEVTSLDVGWHPAEVRRAVLSTLTADGLTWAGAAGTTDLGLRRVGSLLGAGRLSIAAAEAEARRLVIVAVAPDSAPRSPREPAAHARVLGDLRGAWRRPGSHESSIRVRSSAAASITVSGHAAWTDSLGATHGIPFAVVQILEDDGAQGAQVVGTTETDAAGDYAVTVSADDDPGAGAPDIAVEVLARSPFAEIRPEGQLAQAYALRSPVYAEQADGAKLTVNLTAGNTLDGETAFSVHHALVVAGAYASALTGEPPPFIAVGFPSPFSYYAGTTIHIGLLDRWDWDLVQHEYAHHVARLQGLDGSAGGAHCIDCNLGTTDKRAGIRLAWVEGWATFFAVSAQAAMATASLGVPGVGDTSYTDSEDANFSYDLESAQGFGEDNELSVQVALWDLVDGAEDGGDRVALADATIFQALHATSAVTFAEAWEAIAGPLPPDQRALVGAVVAQAEIAPALSEPPDGLGVFPSDPPPAFRWRRNGGGVAHPLDEFRIRFWSDGWSEVIFEKELGDTESFTPTPDELAVILAPGKLVWWVVEGRSTASPETPGGQLGRYWSAGRALRRADSPPRAIRHRLRSE